MHTPRGAWALTVLLACGSESAPPTGVQIDPNGLVLDTAPLILRYPDPRFTDEQVGQVLPRAQFLEVHPELPGELRVTGPSEATFVPAQGLAENVRYQVRALEDPRGRTVSLHRPLFRVLNVDLVSTRPEVVEVELSHPVDLARAEATIRLYDSDGAVLRAEAGLTGQGRVVRLQAEGEVARVEVAPSLRPLIGGEALDKSVVRALLREPQPLRIEEVVVEQRGTRFVLRGRASGDLDQATLIESLAVTPDLPVRVELEPRGFLVRGEFQPGQSYDVVIGAGVKAERGNLLTAGFRERIAIPARRPAVGFDGPYALIEGSRHERVWLEAAETNQVAVEVRKVRPEQLDRIGAAWRDPNLELPPDVGVVVHRGTVAVNQGRNEVELFDPQREQLGVYRLEVKDVARPWVRDRQWVLANELGLVVRPGARALRADVHSLSTGQPVVGAEVVFQAVDGSRLGPVRTGPGGTAELLLDRPLLSPLAFSLARRGTDFAVLPHALTGVALGLDPRPAVRAQLRTQQAAVRPGSSFETLVLTRDDGFRGGATVGASLELVDEEGRVVVKVPANLPDGHGVVNVTVPAEAAPGIYTLRALVGAFELGSEPIVIDGGDPNTPVRLVVETRPDGRFEIRGSSSFGGSVAGTPIHTECWAQSGVGRAERTQVSEGSLDAAGLHLVTCPERGQGDLVRRRLVTYVAGLAKETLAFAEDERVLPAGMLRVSRARSVVRVGEELGVEVRVLDPSGQPQAGQTVHVEWVRRGDRAPNETSLTTTSGPTPLAERPTVPGLYTVRLEYQGVERSTEVQVVGADDAGSLPPGQLLLLPQSSTLIEGAPVTLSSYGPFPGRLDVWAGRERVLLTQSGRAEALLTTLEVAPIPGALPELQLVARLLGPAPAPSLPPKVAYGHVRVPVAPDRLRQPLTLTVAERFEPGPLPVRVQLSGVKGPVPIYLVVTEADLVPERAPDPVAPLIAGLSRSPLIYDLAQVGADEVAAAPAVEVVAPLRSRSSASPRVARILGPLYTNATGELSTSVDLLEARGRLVIDAYAVGFDRLGHARAQVRADPPLALTLLPPAFLRPGDTGAVAVRVEGPEGQKAEVELAITGPGKVTGPARHTIDAGGLGRFAVETAGSGTLHVVARSGLQSAQAEVPVRSAAPLMVVGSYATPHHGEPARFGLPAEITEGRVRIALAPLLPYRHLAAFDALSLPDPRTSAQVARGMAALALKELGEGSLVEQAISTVAARIDDRGWVSEWAAGEGASASVTVDAAHLVVEARRAGRLVPSGVLEPLLGALPKIAGADGDPATRAQALFVLALASRATGAVASNLEALAEPAKKSASLRAILAATAVLARPRAAAELATGGFLPDSVEEPPALRALAIVALADALPRHSQLPALTEALSAMGSTGQFGDPRVNGLALLGLAKAARAEPPVKEYWASLFLAGEALKRGYSGKLALVEVDAEVLRGKELSAFVTGAGTLQLGLSVLGRGAPLTSGGAGLTFTRSCTLDGKPIAEPLRLGARITCRHTVGGATGPVWLRLPLPGAFGRARTRADGTVLEEHAQDGELSAHLAGGNGELGYEVELIATSPGRYELPGASVERLDDPAVRTVTNVEHLVVVE